MTDVHNLSNILLTNNEVIERLELEIRGRHESLEDIALKCDRQFSDFQNLKREMQEMIQEVADFGEVRSLDDSTSANAIENLKSQLHETLKERDAIHDLWQAAVAEIELLETNIVQQRYNSQSVMLENQAKKMELNYQNAVEKFTGEINILRESETQLKSKVNELGQENIVMRKDFDETKSLLDEREKEIEVMKSYECTRIANEKNIMKKLESLQEEMKANTDAEAFLKERCAALENCCIDLQKQLAAAEESSVQAVMQVQQSVALAEASLLEKDVALMKAGQARTECERLQAALTSLVEEAGQRTREEVEQTMSLANANLLSVIEELNLAELDKTNIKMIMENAVKQKDKAEAELSKLQKEIADMRERDASINDGALQKFLDLKTEYNELLVRFDALSADFKREDMKWREERSVLVTDIESLKEQVHSVSLRLKRAQSDLENNQKRMEESEKRYAEAKREAAAVQRQSNMALETLRKSGHLKLQEMEARRVAELNANQQSMSEMRAMLTAQHRMSARWKEECTRISEQFEQKVKKLKNDLHTYQMRNKELQQNLLKLQNDIA